MNRSLELSIVAPDASPQEAAAVVAALERFVRDTARVGAESAPVAARPDAWQQAALREGVARSPELPTSCAY
jgi:hypothetical protein